MADAGRTITGTSEGSIVIDFPAATLQEIIAQGGQLSRTEEADAEASKKAGKWSFCIIRIDGGQ